MLLTPAMAATEIETMSSAEGSYEVRRRVTVAEVPGLRVRELTLAPGQCVPWHHHTHITDTFFCMEGPMQVRTRDPDERHVLAPGATVAIGPNTPHRVEGVNGGACRVMIVQGVGQYDSVPDPD
jgi:quercetin dioxygenase-like cupin family protein